MAQEGIFDAVVLDRMLPRIDGMEVTRRLRAAGMTVPILMLSALSSTQQRVEGLRAGCDDYLAKPYAFIELLARLEALLRVQGNIVATRSPQVADLRLDLDGRLAFRGEVRIALQHREFLLLEKLMRHAGQIVTRSMLLESAWDYDFDPRDNVIDKHVHRLRRKIDHGYTPPLIHTFAGAGYMLSADPAGSRTTLAAPAAAP
jgi:two-component system OmpR family response regulator